MRYFTYRYRGRRQQIGRSGRLYWFSFGGVTPVESEVDANWFLKMGSPESGVYFFREVNEQGEPIGPFPPIDMSKRVAMIDPKQFPSDDSPPASEWREMTETLADPTLYFHHIRQKNKPGGF